ncbi:trypsin-like serine protease [Sphingomonas sp. MAH-20]|uniref:Trypsin-like serine protease n=1 Tax=Sphingomonas horti TaxID=2682842 RepID=A0A6I4IZG6_9SPHN|nr:MULTISPECIES: serine protease [Sphingomonas]MBA2918499.1 trypsin-like peptidase domain-containing protein [Sphingomonas sp. CGMCC 1.13658]MVO77466.1 trypsin-like serine protease [Sphingomonas horti]
MLNKSNLWGWMLALVFQFLPAPALAQDNLDVAAAGRSVVRVVVVAMEGGVPQGIGTGSGVAVAPDKILTNAHVVSDAAEGEAIIGVVPSEGSKRFTGRLIAYQPQRDLALIELTDGHVEPATIATGPVPDGAAVAAVGYPFSVDRARELGAEGFVTPQAPVKSWGHVSGGQSSQRFDTVLHDAAIGRGNSGGPLVDSCGRVVGINSFVSNSEGVDAVFGFAVSVKEIIPFLRAAGVKPHTTGLPCRTSAEQAAIDERLARSEDERAQAERNRAAYAEERMDARREQVRDRILAERDNGLAVAGLLLVFGVAFVNGALVLLSKDDRRVALGAGAAGLVLMAGAPIAWVARPDLDQADARLAAAAPKASPKTAATAVEGAYACRLDLERSRITISEPRDVTLDWAAPSCEGGAPFAAEDDRWVRAEVSPTEGIALVRRFDPAASRYTVERYLLPADTLAAARALQAKHPAKSCSADGARAAGDMTQALRDLLPPAPNERLVYSCDHVPPAQGS